MPIYTTACVSFPSYPIAVFNIGNQREKLLIKGEVGVFFDGSILPYYVNNAKDIELFSREIYKNFSKVIIISGSNELLEECIRQGLFLRSPDNYYVLKLKGNDNINWYTPEYFQNYRYIFWE